MDEAKSLWHKMLNATTISAIGILAGTLFYALVLTLAEWYSTTTYIGDFVYNYYFLSVLNGDLAVPLQIIGLEGHYDEYGRAMVYHGIAPMITRALAHPFIDLSQTDLRDFTIWLASSLGSAAFYILIRNILRTASPMGFSLSKPLELLVWVMVWITGGGMILVVNGSFFHEPIAVGFAALGWFLLCVFHLQAGDFRSGKLLVVMACLAAICGHARPHIAVGLYAAVAVCSLIMLFRQRSRAIVAVLVSMGVLGAAGLLYMGLNQLRFGSVSIVDGGVTGVEEVLYGFVFWGIEEPNSPRFLSAAEHGRFNVLRMLPNFAYYHFGLFNVWTTVNYWVLTSNAGIIRIEAPALGFLYIWPAWLYLSAVGFVRRQVSGTVVLVMLLAALPGVLLVYSYPTITMRYRVELWAPYFIMGAFGLRSILIGSSGEAVAGVGAIRLTTALTALAVVVSAIGFVAYADYVNWDWGQYLRAFESCEQAVSNHPNLGVNRVAELCVIGAPE